MEIRRFDSENESFDKLIQLFKTGLGDTDEHFWEWKYLYDTGFDKQIMYVIEDNSEIIAMMGFVPQDYIDKNGNIHKFVQTCDLVVRPDYRGRGLFYKICNHAHEDLNNCGYEAFIAFPNENSMHGFSRMGYKFIDMNGYFVSKDYKMLVLHKIGLGKKYNNKSKYNLNVIFGDFENTVCKLGERNVETITEKSIRLNINPQYLKWRCDDYKEGEYRSVTVKDGDNLVAYFIILITKGRLTTAAKIVNFDIDKRYIEDLNIFAEEFKKLIYAFADSIDFYAVWSDDVERLIVDSFGIKQNCIKKSGIFAIKMLGNRQFLKDKMFINHIDTDL